jgi:transposase
MNIRYRVDLSEAERTHLTALLSGGKHAARKIRRAQIVLAAGAGVSDEVIASSLSVGGSTVYRTKRRFVQGSLALALSEQARPGAPRKLSGKETALLVATACSNPPEGRKRWTLGLLAGAMVRMAEHEGLSREHYPHADQIRVVMDNLSTHTVGALYEAFPAAEAHRIVQRLAFHYTPKHASWLNMVEIEIGVLRGQCLDRRIGERSVLNTEVAAWQRQRNASGARIKWRFTTQKARQTLARAYPDTAKEPKSL